MAVDTKSLLLPRDSMFRPESDDEESFVVLGHSLSPEPSEELKNDLADAITTTVVHDAVNLTTSALERMNSSTPTFPLMEQPVNPSLSIQTRDVSLNTIATNFSADLSPDEIQQKVDMLVEENLKLKETLHQNNLAMKKQYDTLVLWQNDVMSVHKSHKEKFAETKSYIEKLKLEKAELINVLHLKEAEIAVLKEQLNEFKCVKTTSSIKQISKRSFDNLAEFELENAKKKIAELEQQLREEKDNQIITKETVDRQLEDLQTELSRCKLDNEKLDKSLNKQMRESESLQKILLEEIKNLKERIMNESIEKQNQRKVEEQLMAAQMHITELQLSSDKNKELINENEEKIKRLQEEVTALTADNAALQVQMDVYSKDFEAERQAKQNIGVEKETIAENLRDVQRRNQQLLEELERLRNNDYVYVGREEGAAVASQEANEFLCPKCSRRYPNYSALEAHVYPCVEETDSSF